MAVSLYRCCTIAMKSRVCQKFWTLRDPGVGALVLCSPPSPLPCPPPTSPSYIPAPIPSLTHPTICRPSPSCPHFWCAASDSAAGSAPHTPRRPDSRARHCRRGHPCGAPPPARAAAAAAASAPRPPSPHTASADTATSAGPAACPSPSSRCLSFPRAGGGRPPLPGPPGSAHPPLGTPYRAPPPTPGRRRGKGKPQGEAS